MSRVPSQDHPWPTKSFHVFVCPLARVSATSCCHTEVYLTHMLHFLVWLLCHLCTHSMILANLLARWTGGSTSMLLLEKCVFDMRAIPII